MIRRISLRLPRWLKDLRGRLLLEAYAWHLGVEEVPCGACGASGWLDERCWRRCPICQGFGEVPKELDDWFDAQLLREQARERGGPAPADEGEHVPPRFGLCGELLHRVSLCDLSEVAGFAPGDGH